MHMHVMKPISKDAEQSDNIDALRFNGRGFFSV